MVNNPPVASFSVPTGRWGRYLGIGRVFSACLQLNPCISNSCDSHSAEPSPLMAVHFRLKFDFTLQGVRSLFPFLISLPTYGVCVQSTISRPPMCHLKDWLTHFADGVQHHLQSNLEIMNRRLRKWEAVYPLGEELKSQHGVRSKITEAQHNSPGRQFWSMTEQPGSRWNYPGF